MNIKKYEYEKSKGSNENLKTAHWQEKQNTTSKENRQTQIYEIQLKT